MNQPGSLKVDITGLEKCYLVWWVLIPGCNIWMAGSEFCLNIKVWIYPAFYQQERLFLVVMWGIYCDNCILINYLNISSTTICIQSWPALPSPVLMAALWGKRRRSTMRVHQWSSGCRRTLSFRGFVKRKDCERVLRRSENTDKMSKAHPPELKK